MSVEAPVPAARPRLVWSQDRGGHTPNQPDLIKPASSAVSEICKGANHGQTRSYAGSRKWRNGLTGGRYSGMWGVAASEADREGMVARLTPSRHHELAMVSTIQKSSNLSSVLQSHSIMRHSVDTQGIASSRCQCVRGYCQANRNACVAALEPSTSTIGRSRRPKPAFASTTPTKPVRSQK
jgi:hypothetical protein